VPHPQRCVQAVRVHAATSASLRFGKIEGRPRGECYVRRTRWHSFHTIPIPARKNPTNLDPYFLRGRPKPVFEIASKCAGCRFRRTNGTLTTWNGRYEESSTGFSRIFVRTSGHVLSNSQTKNGTSKSLPNLPSSYGWARLRTLQTDHGPEPRRAPKARDGPRVGLYWSDPPQPPSLRPLHPRARSDQDTPNTFAPVRRNL
jgi:hypothetical protein